MLLIVRCSYCFIEIFYLHSFSVSAYRHANICFNSILTHSSLPLHWAVAKDQPNLEVIYQLVAAYPEGLFDPDYEGHLPYDK